MRILCAPMRRHIMFRRSFAFGGALLVAAALLFLTPVPGQAAPRGPGGGHAGMGGGHYGGAHVGGFGGGYHHGGSYYGGYHYGGYRPYYDAHHFRSYYGGY